MSDTPMTEILFHDHGQCDACDQADAATDKLIASLRAELSALRAAQERGEAVAWMYETQVKGESDGPCSWVKRAQVGVEPAESLTVRNVRPLVYAAPAPAAGMKVMETIAMQDYQPKGDAIEQAEESSVDILIQCWSADGRRVKTRDELIEKLRAVFTTLRSTAAPATPVDEQTDQFAFDRWWQAFDPANLLRDYQNIARSAWQAARAQRRGE